ncbi:rhodanese-related sulfurtransferase [Paenibacillus rhizosphaerae]|uniref:Rhodanese-related sulfurtransferase n=1 Tax=Paenibacillus rhizosphaerae TaxID=297318 RepID=A0A839TTE5_9BACL|nr:rhodanese-like domain-containing protein [Paenibacillus rhizosphaerae]MBB3128559.1 rhodanese-related sulfurtransferase [Paenibacillus rhizosphaerae]
MAFNVAKTVTPQEVAAKLKRGEQLNLLDVREPEEWAVGHVAGAKHIPLGQLSQRYNELKQGEELIVLCRSGNRSGLACELLAERGFDVINMTGGLNAWIDELVTD